VYGTFEVVRAPGLQPIAIVPAVVYLERSGPGAPDAMRDRAVEPERVNLGANGFTPKVVAIGSGWPLAVTNTSGVHHEIFWLQGAERNTVDLPPDPNAVVQLGLAGHGIKRLYCALHSDEYFSAYLAPSPHFALVEASGPFFMDGVDPGDWRLSIWSEAVEGWVADIRVAPGRDTKQDVRIDTRLVRKRNPWRGASR
jgi:hypothetical protein